MAAPAITAASGGGIGKAFIDAAGDVTEAGIKAVVDVLSLTVVVEFGPQGYKIGGRRRTRVSGKKDNPVRNKFDDRVLLRRVEVPVFVFFAAAYMLGWRPGGVIGALVEALFGKGKMDLTGQALSTVENFVLPALTPLFGGLWHATKAPSKKKA